MHEIVTLQLGQRSNYLATHFWNTQESYFTYSADEVSLIDHDVHFRQGVGADGSETYTPRTIIYDLKGGFGTLRQYNALYDLENSGDVASALWTGQKVVEKQPAITQSEYQKNLDLGLPAPKLTSESVRYWSDYNRLFYHPRSIVQLNDYELHSQTMPFEAWGAGEELFKEVDHEHDIIDRDFRLFAEECDQMRGIQIFTGTDDAWGGFAARYVDRLRDEFGKTSIWLWGSEDGTTQQRQKKVLQSLNCARSINEISPQVNAYIPLTTLPRNLPPWINLHPGSDWYASALLATAVESVTLPTRLKPGAGGGSVDWLPGEDHPQKIYQLQQQIRQENEELPEDRIDGKEDEFMGKDDYEQDEDLSAGFDVNLSPTTSGTNTGHIFGQIRMCRNSGGERRNSELNISIQRPRYTDILKSGAILQKYNTTLLFPLLDSFPDDMFTSSTHKPKALKTRSVLSTTSHTKDQLQELQTLASRGIAIDEREALVNGLGEISEAYKHGWEDESDSEDI